LLSLLTGSFSSLATSPTFWPMQRISFLTEQVREQALDLGIAVRIELALSLR
jgi:hypothetical protein